MHEIDCINSILKNFKRSPDQKNDPFQSDAEILDINGELFGITMDEFSSGEDMFDVDDLFKLGKNLAVATISDLLAVSCTPAFFMHSIVYPADNHNFAPGIAAGIKNILDQCNCFLIGGDLGQSASWHYTAVVFGTFKTCKPTTRIIPHHQQDLWITGTLGDANLSALTGLPTPEFELRLEQADMIKQCANACIDTSGGLIESLWTLKDLNPGISFYINSESIPYDKSVLDFCAKEEFPKEAFLFGGAGEYELLFTTDFAIEIAGCRKIGTIKPTGKSQLFWDNKPINKPPADPREFINREQYIQKIMEDVKQCL
ncbi:MAG: hypothetical protein JEZ07_10705 [Phycisphaerae bacterium]|nr:hypothetical protein [Phycisphaerae bacterium]